ncbi:hypothetical protein [Leptolyngbya sp. FACHB-261]|uniref:hypothetical protein n=1 Tax=Leptolyngbya sp. FACHB-261 TaxID=2692806 RepID=UPI001683DFAC|nr:hypothetical protein [Leptolyngbya sp. FACHB-261]MBD2103993.1 hypothetical protein [Leptolyngbya sp. FACHB-261]
MTRIIDPDRFVLLGTLIDWAAVRRRHLNEPRAEQLARQRQISTKIVQLRWLVHPELGYPTEPFKVWRRPALPLQLEKAITPEILNTSFGFRVIKWDEPQVFIRARFQVSGSNASVVAYAGAPFASAAVDLQTLLTGSQEAKFSGPAIQCLVVMANADLQNLVGISDKVADDPSWQLVEQVGLPVTADWAGVFNLGALQGMQGALIQPPAAALDRYRRGAPLYGWEAVLEGTTPAPPWQLANPAAIIQTLRNNLLGPLKQMITSRPPNQHNSFELQNQLPPPGGGDPATTRFKPMSTLLFGASTDPLLSLIAGFGTAFDDIDLPPISISDRKLFDNPSRSDCDYMVTARYERGADGKSAPIEYAAILFSPRLATTPPTPANLSAAGDGHKSPAALDQPWQGVIRLGWDKIPDTLPFRVGSYAMARSQQAPSGGVVALMGKRPFDSALQPISATTSLEQEQTLGRLQALDETYDIASTPSPNGLRYGLAHQDLFGLWSSWATTGHQISEPAAQSVAILSSRFEVTAPASGSACQAQLVVELTWDWKVRSPQQLELVGRLYPQAKRGVAPADISLPNRLPKSLVDLASPSFKITFSGGNVGTPDPGGTIEYLSDDGKNIVPNPPTLAGPRRYRITISFELDFASTGHIGLALWARGQENRLPQRLGPWSAQPSIVSASDPRPPVLNIQHEDVLLASMADASGEHHARLAWDSVAGAVGYFIYTTTETKLRVDRGLADPNLSETLSQRLVALRDAFAAQPTPDQGPSRRSFTRLNDQPLTGTSTQITLPRGSKEIHLYVILGVSASQIESAWPDASDPDRRRRPIAYAAPQVAAPSPPTLEVSRILDKTVDPHVYRAALRIQTRSGATVSRIDLHRVRVPEASLSLDTMGPPIAKLSGSAPPWEVTATPGTGPGEAQPIGTIKGSDSPEGSWKRVFYRAVAWSGDDLTRGIYGGRSLPSAAQEVVIPTSTAPQLSAISSTWPGGALSDILLTVTSEAPINETPLGPHRLKVDVRAARPDGSLQPLYAYPVIASNSSLDNTLEKIPTTQPAPEIGGLWRQAGAAPGTTQYKILVKRASIDEVLKVWIQMSDPLGRATEQTLEVAAGSPLAAPVIEMPVVTKVLGKGFIFSFETSVPVAPTPIGPYLLKVGFAAGPLLPILLPGRRLPQRGPSVGVELPLSQIPLASAGEDAFNEAKPIPVRRTKLAGSSTRITVFLRGSSGQITVVLEAPDGRTKSVRRSLQ